MFKCSKCRKNYSLDHYIKNDKILKRCIRCRDIITKSRNNSKCKHNKQQYQCVYCMGDGICNHYKYIHSCIRCREPKKKVITKNKKVKYAITKTIGKFIIIF